MTLGLPVSQNRSLSKRPKLMRLQSIRGLAAVLVLLFHATEISNRNFGQPWFGNIFAWGDGGVDLFFVLSGFILWYAHSRDLHQPWRLRSFLCKRLIRIYPLYWALTLVMVGVYFAVPSAGVGHETQPLTVMKSLLLFPVEPFPVLTVGWSLCHEILFYGVFALLLGLRPLTAGTVLGGWLGATLMLQASQWLGMLPGELPFTLKFLLSSHNLEFGLGMGVAALVLKQPERYPGQLLLAGGLGSFVLMGLLREWGGSLWPPFLAYGLPSALAILGAAVLDLRQPLTDSMAGIALGDASYALYLSHYGVLSAVGLGLGRLPLPGGVALGLSGGVMLAIAVGFWLHRHLEKPLTRRLSAQFL